MVHAITVVLHLSVFLFAAPVAPQGCVSYNDSRGDLVLCREWTPFCCGSCDMIYCCNDPEEKLTTGCFRGATLQYSSDSPHHMARDTAVIVLLVFFTFIIIMFIFCCCCHRKHFRNVSHTMPTATQYHPQRSQYSHYQPVSNNPQLAYGWQTTPSGPSQGQLYVLGPPPSYHEAGGYPVPLSQATSAGGQAMISVQTPVQAQQPADYTSPPPAYNPAYNDSPKTTY